MMTKKVYLSEKLSIFDFALSHERQRYSCPDKSLKLFSSQELPFITRSQLALRNGQDKPEIWVAYNNLVYDVTASRLWQRGKHYEHWAGQDLSSELKDAPHTDKVFDKFKVIGKLKI